MDRLLDLSLRKLIHRFRRHVLREHMPVVATQSVIQLLGAEAYRNVSELGRFEDGEVVVHGQNVKFTDNGALFGMLDEIYVRENYRFDCDTRSPTIIDCGANIGLSVMYFKSLYPGATVHALEPDPGAYAALVENLHDNGIEGVTAENKAVWTEETELHFAVDGSWGGHLQAEGSGGINVRTCALDNLLKQRVDLLKMDIEGAESDVIMHSKEPIARNVEKMFFEWHSLIERPQRLGEILAFFEKNGFRYHIKEASNRSSPFIYKPYGRMDSQLDVFLWK